jgi:Family of unknown function (DUF5329)
MKRWILGIGLLVSSVVWAEELSVQSKQEVAHLFSYLEHSGCEFNRNGSWYNGKDAVAHLNKKYHYLLDKGWVASTEMFIERGASQSSISSKSYLVRCGTAAPVESKAWFSAELAKYRLSKH